MEMCADGWYQSRNMFRDDIHSWFYSLFKFILVSPCFCQGNYFIQQLNRLSRSWLIWVKMVRRSGGSGVAISTCACFSRQIVTFSLKNGGVTLRCVSLIPNKLLYMHNTWLAGMDLNWSQQSDMAIYSILVIAFSILKAFCKGHLKKCTQPDCETLILVDLICAI